ncbi:hypothetical protein CcrC1_gp276 [Caulobacter phage C1]|nr:hypothetical protein CcrC1_gp276 [Caulobacter phage C1]UTU08505.1 hypothetical protein CcrC2_gp277 [Caulobacter phage C2]UTU09020.1 hypothetical protein CcrJ4_gp271 [Caulobacter phage J4]UTU09581.1 hypothetical protein CcrBL47_gp295 [Caulobacter phage BL47]UTU10138.1 hypothetical protein CcrRB23_gp276 [Caulobacter phage RB23]WGN97172.1 hypothetical protein [Bertelyvirus sp.]
MSREDAVKVAEAVNAIGDVGFYRSETMARLRKAFPEHVDVLVLDYPTGRQERRATA